MDNVSAWSTGLVGDEVTGHGSLLTLLDRTGLTVPDGRRVTVPIVCRYCAADEFEVSSATDEVWCVGCCLPIGIEDGEVYSGTPEWRLVRSDVPPSGTGNAVRKEAAEYCPAGHGVFLVAVAYTLAADGAVRALSVGLKCPEDGALRLHVDDARVVREGA
jgi:hypothetical protein